MSIRPGETQLKPRWPKPAHTRKGKRALLWKAIQLLEQRNYAYALGYLLVLRAKMKPRKKDED